MAGIGYGKYSARQVLAKFAPAGAQPMSDTEEQAASHGFTSLVRRVFGGDSKAIVVRGHGDLLVYRARCCNPIRGEAIVGYVTRGKGVAVHSINCPNVTNLLYEPDRRIDVLWAGDKDGKPVAYPVKIPLLCADRFGLLKKITALISDTHTKHRRFEPPILNGQPSASYIHV